VVDCFKGVKQMTTTEQEERDIERELETLSKAGEALAELHERIAPRFRRAEVRQRALRFLEGLLAPLERKNGWQLAEELGESGPQGVQRLLNAANWDEEAVRDDLRAYVLHHLEDEHGVLVVDETGFVKKGKKSVGVARQYSGTAGRRENCQIGVFLSYASRSGHAFLDRALYLPEEWTQDRVRCREAGVPEEVSFATKGELAQQMLGRAFAAGVQAEWVVADTVYGYDEMRDWLESRQQKYVLAVPETHLVWSRGESQPVGLLAALLPPEVWVPLSAGEGSQGPRLYEWAWLELPYEREGVEGWTSWLLIRRSLADPSKRAYYRAWGPASTPLTTLVRVAGSRWTIEEGFEQGKGEVGLDQYEVRTWTAWHRFITLALLAHAFLVVMRLQAEAQEPKKGEMSAN
jgi:SRSO17 transposase